MARFALTISAGILHSRPIDKPHAGLRLGAQMGLGAFGLALGWSAFDWFAPVGIGLGAFGLALVAHSLVELWDDRAKDVENSRYVKELMGGDAHRTIRGPDVYEPGVASEQTRTIPASVNGKSVDLVIDAADDLLVEKCIGFLKACAVANGEAGGNTQVIPSYRVMNWKYNDWRDAKLALGEAASSAGNKGTQLTGKWTVGSLLVALEARDVLPYRAGAPFILNRLRGGK